MSVSLAEIDLEHRMARIRKRVTGRRQTRYATMIASILAGVPLSLVAPLILGTIFWFTSWWLIDWTYSWSWFFLAMAVVTIPLLFRLEAQTAGNYLSVAVTNSKPLLPAYDELCVGLHLTQGALVGALFG